MIKKILTLIIIGVFFGSKAQIITTKGVSIEALSGYSKDNLSFSIAGNEKGTNPNIYSELKWEKIQYTNYGIAINYNTNRWEAQLGYLYSDAFKGDVNDKDYSEDNRQGIFSDLLMSSHKGYKHNPKLKVGYKIINRKNTSFSAGVYSDFLNQKLTLLNNPYPDDNPEYDYQEDLDSYYKTKWLSVGGYLNIQHNIIQTLNVGLSTQWGYTSYDSYANWNLRPFRHPKSFTHTGKGYNHTTRLAITKLINDKIEISGQGAYSNALIKNGKDLLYREDNTSVPTKLNEVKWNSWQFLIGIKYIF